jgi:hypothetical protein
MAWWVRVCQHEGLQKIEPSLLKWAGQALAAENIVRQAVIAFPRRNARLSSPGARRHVTHLIEHLHHRRPGGGIGDLVTDGYFAVDRANVDQRAPAPRPKLSDRSVGHRSAREVGVHDSSVVFDANVPEQPERPNAGTTRWHG